MDTAGTASKTPTAPAGPNSKRARTGLIIGASVVLVPIAALVIWMLTHTEEVPRMDRPGFDAARAKWRESGVESYDMDILFVGGSKPKNIHIEVRDNQVVNCLENGEVPTQKNAWDNFTVNNQFAMIAEDLDKSEVPNGFKTRSNVTITLHAIFDPELGYPRHYLRKARGNSPLHSQWRILDFKRL